MSLDASLSSSVPDAGARRSRTRSFFGTRQANLVAGLAYLFLFSRVYRDYISIEWAYSGLIYRPLGFWDHAFIYGAVALVSAALPLRIARPSAVVLWLMYGFVYVPSMAITFMIGAYGPEYYVGLLAALTAALLFLCWMAQRPIEGENAPRALPSLVFQRWMIGGYLVLSAIIYYQFRDILQFAGIEDIYYQRFAAADMTSLLIGYARTYYTYVFSSVLVAFGLAAKGQRYVIGIAMLGFLLSYMIDASKISLIIPLAMFAFYLVVSLRRNYTVFLTGGLAALSLLCATLTDATRILRFFADLVLLRSIAIPGQTLSQYYDVFSAKGYTYWSSISLINQVVPPPVAFSADQNWPVLGLIVGSEYYGFSSRVNLNANPFVGEGAAAAGAIGVIVIGLALGFFLRALDRYSVGWDRTFVLLLMVPVGLTLTNVHLSTFLLSFGGVIWLLLLKFYKPVSGWR